jgi:hypothetical protein
MITISKEADIVTLINVFTCRPETQQHLIDAWIRATEATLGKIPGIISAALHRSKDGTRVVNYAQWRTSEGWEQLLEVGKQEYFKEMGKFGTPDAHLYDICYVLDKSRPRN